MRAGVGARYTFGLADPRRPGTHVPIELWTVEAVAPTLVAAGMSGGSDAYEEFVVRPLDGGGCEATLTLVGHPARPASPRTSGPLPLRAAWTPSARSSAS